MTREEYQSVILTLSDGTTVTFTGKVAVRPGDKRLITKIVFTEPGMLPEGTFFEEISKEAQ